MKTWAERNPHPGEAPPRPSDEHPTDAAAMNTWWIARHTWDAYVRKLRKYQVAVAIDLLDRTGDALKPEQMIARAIGACWLDGSLVPPSLF